MGASAGYPRLEVRSAAPDATSPQPYYVAQARGFWRGIACPMLYVDGAESGLRLDAADLAARLAILRARHVRVDAAGHHPHIERPEAFADVVIRFLADVE
jgi:pimeloyl-ACP methyl ester carboxylesterase